MAKKQSSELGLNILKIIKPKSSFQSNIFKVEDLLNKTKPYVSIRPITSFIETGIETSVENVPQNCDIEKNIIKLKILGVSLNLMSGSKLIIRVCNNVECYDYEINGELSISESNIFIVLKGGSNPQLVEGQDEISDIPIELVSPLTVSLILKSQSGNNEDSVEVSDIEIICEPKTGGGDGTSGVTGPRGPQ